VLFWGQLAGFAVLAVAAAGRGRAPNDPALLLAIPAAVSGTLGIYAYYRGMAVGAMAVVAPIAGASAVVPVVFGIVHGDSPSAWQLAGIACALVGVVLASQEHQEAGQRRVAAGVGLALLAAVGFGFYFPAMHAAGDADPLWASTLFRLASFVIIALGALIRRPPIRLGGWKLVIVVGVGLGDTFGNFLYAAAAHAGGLVSLTSVLASLYPIVTVMLAAAVLHERVARWQRVGIALTLTGVVLIAV
jgi:drug/metabolite transporter (DMT)-like permease